MEYVSLRKVCDCLLFNWLIILGRLACQNIPCLITKYADTISAVMITKTKVGHLVANMICAPCHLMRRINDHSGFLFMRKRNGQGLLLSHTSYVGVLTNHLYK